MRKFHGTDKMTSMALSLEGCRSILSTPGGFEACWCVQLARQRAWTSNPTHIPPCLLSYLPRWSEFPSRCSPALWQNWTLHCQPQGSLLTVKRCCEMSECTNKVRQVNITGYFMLTIYQCKKKNTSVAFVKRKISQAECWDVGVTSLGSYFLYAVINCS